MTKPNMKESKVYLRMEAEKLRRKEVVENYRAFNTAKEEMLAAKAVMKAAAKDYVRIVCESKDKDEITKAKAAFDMAQKEYTDAAHNVELLYSHLKELEALRAQSKVDRNVVIKCATFAGVAFITELIELPGNLVNLRAVKTIKPITDLLRL